MNQTIFKRAAGFLTAFAMMMLVVLGAVPVKAAGMSVSASTSATVSAEPLCCEHHHQRLLHEEHHCRRKRYGSWQHHRQRYEDRRFF